MIGKIYFRHLSYGVAAAASAAAVFEGVEVGRTGIERVMAGSVMTGL